MTKFNTSFKETADGFAGREYATHDYYYFQYTTIRNYLQEPLGYVGVGIPQRTFEQLLQRQSALIVLAIAISLPLIFFVQLDLKSAE